MRIIFIFIFLMNCSLSRGEVRLNEVRKLYYQATLNEDSCQTLLNLVQSYSDTDNPTLGAYKACAMMIMCKYHNNPFSNFLNFTKGKKMLEKCVYADKKNVEIRYLRYSMQSNSPSFLGYNNFIAEDKAFLLKALDTISDLQLKQMMISALKSSKYLSSLEKSDL